MQRPFALPNLIGLPPFETATPRTLAPSLGEHTATILQEHGYKASEIAALAARGVIRLGHPA
jgi:crotonobetainyl-CoA:carnitine CoA-transferase CaiB-like acyl-CoA transferase